MKSMKKFVLAGLVLLPIPGLGEGVHEDRVLVAAVGVSWCLAQIRPPAIFFCVHIIIRFKHAKNVIYGDNFF